jgi:hypothetical protein
MGLGVFGRRVRLLVAALAAAAVALTASPALAGSAGTVRTGDGTALTVRAAPGAGYYGYAGVGDGAAVDIACQVGGDTVGGTQGQSALWDQLAGGGFVSDAYVYTGSAGQVAPTCSYSAAPPRPNPRGMDDAINWEFQHLGATDYEGWCLAFQGQAFGWSYTGFESAYAEYQWLSANGQVNGGVPPRGALVWYSGAGGYGHVTVSLGGGNVIGTSVGGHVGVAGYNYLGSFLGWSTPHFPKGGVTSAGTRRPALIDGRG